MVLDGNNKLRGVVEVNEVFVGGKNQEKEDEVLKAKV